MPERAREDAQFAAGRALIERLRASGAEIHASAQLWAAFDLDDIRVLAPEGRWQYQARALILAPGAYERPLPLPGWTLARRDDDRRRRRRSGVATESRRGKRVLISGNGPLNMQVAAELTRGGVEVVGLAELATPASPLRAPALARMALSNSGLVRDGLRYRTILARARVPVMYGASVVRVEGESQANAAVVMKLDAQGRPRVGSERRFEVDAVCMGFGFVPSTDTARMLGCRHEYDAASGQLVTQVTEVGRTSRDDVWIVGDSGGIRGAHHARAQGVLAALDAAGRLGGVDAQKLEALGRMSSATQAPSPLSGGARKGVCRAAAAGRAGRARHARLSLRGRLARGCGAGAKRRRRPHRRHQRVTRVGMGPCGGRYCAPVVTAMVARSTGAAPGELSGFAPTPPVKPVVIGDLVASAADLITRKAQVRRPRYAMWPYRTSAPESRIFGVDVDGDLNVFTSTAPAGCRDWRGHVIICGIVAMTLRTVEQLLAAGARVVVLEDEYASERDLLALKRLHVP